MIPSLHLSLLGDFLLLSGETPVTTITLPRVQSLLAYLVLHRRAPQDRSHLAFLLWPDSTEAQAHTNLRQLLYHLRQSLPYADQCLSVTRQSLHWHPGPDVSFTLDVEEFEQALARARQAEQANDLAQARQALELATHLYRADLFPSCYEEWIFPERERLHQLFLQAAERLMALLEQERAYSTAIKVAQHLLLLDPLHEATYRQLMRLQALGGERAAALRTYHNCASHLERDLGTAPSEETRQVYALLTQQASPEERSL